MKGINYKFYTPTGKNTRLSHDGGLKPYWLLWSNWKKHFVLKSGNVVFLLIRVSFWKRFYVELGTFAPLDLQDLICPWISMWNINIKQRKAPITVLFCTLMLTSSWKAKAKTKILVLFHNLAGWLCGHWPSIILQHNFAGHARIFSATNCLHAQIEIEKAKSGDHVERIFGFLKRLSHRNLLPPVTVIVFFLHFGLNYYRWSYCFALRVCD